MLQVVVTVWVSAHPVTYTIPKLYSQTDGGRACTAAMDRLWARRAVQAIKRIKRMTLECLPTNNREA